MTPKTKRPLVDPFGRRITYLRLSVTDRCDLRCVYCMAEDQSFLPKSQVLSLEELGQVAQLGEELFGEQVQPASAVRAVLVGDLVSGQVGRDEVDRVGGVQGADRLELRPLGRQGQAVAALGLGGGRAAAEHALHARQRRLDEPVFQTSGCGDEIRLRHTPRADRPGRRL